MKHLRSRLFYDELSQKLNEVLQKLDEVFLEHPYFPKKLAQVFYENLQVLEQLQQVFAKLHEFPNENSEVSDGFSGVLRKTEGGL